MYTMQDYSHIIRCMKAEAFKRVCGAKGALGSSTVWYYGHTLTPNTSFTITLSFIIT